jgi:hypothetical protein
MQRDGRQSKKNDCSTQNDMEHVTHLEAAKTTEMHHLTGVLGDQRLMTSGCGNSKTCLPSFRQVLR